jgi:hypothetical protein
MAMSVNTIQCEVAGCKTPPMHGYMLQGEAHYVCENHLHTVKRCLSNTTDQLGNCYWCQAVNGESCRG